MIRRAAIATLLVVGCHGKGDSSPMQGQNAPAPQQPGPGKLADAKPPTPAPAKIAPPVQPTEAPADAKVADAKLADAKAADPLGKRFADPAWFRKSMFEGASLFRASRGEADENGLFASQMTFNLKEGTTVADCEKLMEEKIGKHVGAFQREEKAEGKRIFLRKKTARMDITLVCGDAKGTTRAYVAYEWTS